MEYNKYLPHLYGALNIMNSQLNEWDKNFESSLLPSEKSEMKTVREIASKMKKTVNFFQLESAKGNTKESVRLIQIFYGLLWMVRPSIEMLEDLRLKEAGVETSNRKTLESVLTEISVKENAH